MKNENKKKIQEVRETPVSDGDTRPDQQPQGQDPSSNGLADNAKETSSDVNSLEDYKDSSGNRPRVKRERAKRKSSSPLPYQHDEENE